MPAGKLVPGTTDIITRAGSYTIVPASTGSAKAVSHCDNRNQINANGRSSSAVPGLSRNPAMRAAVDQPNGQKLNGLHAAACVVIIREEWL
ncbi:hypothetical protein RB195_003297 [Necator americanus]|uniref:Uncharacterized protein n=1 Tax=Necator americanus TaxID=51031 RepID=A0ABR1DMX0_NECAM